MTGDSDVAQDSVRNWQSVRTLLELLIFSGVLYLAHETQNQVIATVALQTQMRTQIEEVRTLRSQLENVASLARNVAQIQIRMEDDERRLNNVEQGQRHP